MNQQLSMKTLLDSLKEKKIIKTEKVYNSMLKVDRKDFINKDPYEDLPQNINYNATISAPHMHAYALEYLSDYLIPNSHILDIGSGSGYL
jgi:protein-L-isoaspartate(D-aspartate) O-methyltransferase